MPESMYDTVIRNLAASRGRWPTLAEEVGMPYGTLRKIATKQVVDPGFSLVEKLHKHFAKHPPRAA